MLRGLGHEQSPELSQMWAGLALLQMCELNSATGAAAGRDLGRWLGKEISRGIGITVSSARPGGDIGVTVGSKSFLIFHS